MDETLKLKAEQLAGDFATRAQTLDDLNGLIRNLMKSALERMLDTEMDVHLGHKQLAAVPSDDLRLCPASAPKNRRNGHSHKTVQGDLGEVTLDSQEFRLVLQEHGLTHHRIKPHCPEENGLMERAYRTLREALDGKELQDLLAAERAMARIIRWYNEERLHSALGYLAPVDYYRGHPEQRKAERRRKIVQARHRRRERNLGLEQGTLAFVPEEVVA